MHLPYASSRYPLDQDGRHKLSERSSTIARLPDERPRTVAGLQTEASHWIPFAFGRRLFRCPSKGPQPTPPGQERWRRWPRESTFKH